MAADGFLHSDDGTVGAPPRLVLRQAGEEPLDQVDPGAFGRREVAVEPGMAEQPPLHPAGLVGSVVVQDYVDLQVLGDGVVDVPQEADEVDAAVAVLVAHAGQRRRQPEGGFPCLLRAG